MSKLWNHEDYILVIKEKIQSLVVDQYFSPDVIMQFDHLWCSLTQKNSQLGSVKKYHQKRWINHEKITIMEIKEQNLIKEATMSC